MSIENKNGMMKLLGVGWKGEMTVNIKHRSADFYAIQYKITQEEAASIAASYNRCADTLFNDTYYYGAYVGMVIILYAQGRLSLKYKEMLLNEVAINAHYFTTSLADK